MIFPQDLTPQKVDPVADSFYLTSVPKNMIINSN